MSAVTIVPAQETDKEPSESEKRFRSLFANTPIGYGLASIDGRFIDANPALCAILGYSLGELHTLTFPELVHPDDLDTQAQLIKQLLAGEIPNFVIENRFIRNGGDSFWVRKSVSTFYDNQEKMQRLVALVEDITERKQMTEELNRHRSELSLLVEERTQDLKTEIAKHQKTETALNQSQQHLEEAQRIAHLGSWEWTAATDTPQASKELNRILGIFDHSTLTLTGAESLFSQESYIRMQEAMAHCMRTGEPYEIEVERVWGNDKVTSLLARGERWLDDQGQIIGLRGTALDITRLKQFENELRESNLSLQNVIVDLEKTQLEMLHQARLAAVGQLAAGIAHDFNNILATIILYAERMKTAPNLDENERHRLSVIHDQAKRGDELVQQILDFSRSSMLRIESVNLASLLQEQVELLRRTLPEHIEIQLRFEPRPYITNADRTRMQQILTNLAINARDAMPDGGILRIELSHMVVDSDQSPPVPEMKPGAWIKLTIADTGTGIAPENMEHIFEPFFTTKGPGKGTGLGLPQVYGIVQQHGGYIAVESQWGEGVTFTVYLPAEETVQEVTPPSPVSGTPLGQQAETILVVEDNPWFREALVDILDSLNYRAVEAANGRAALQVLAEQQEHIVLVISDFIMPDMGGRELILALKAQNLSIPVILISGHQMGDQISSMEQEGVVGWLGKPFSAKTMAKLVADVMHKR